MGPLLHLDSLAVASLAAHALLVGMTLAAAPRKDLAGTPGRDLLLVAGGTWLAYVAGNPWLFALGWAISSAPLLRTGTTAAAGSPLLPRLFALASLAAVVLGLALLAFSEAANPRNVGFLALIFAVLLRKAIFPFHFWVGQAFRGDSLLAVNLLLNGHLGAYLLLRFAVPQDPTLAAAALPVLSALAIGTAILTALVALVKQRPRDILAMLSVSQASFLLAGLENRNLEGITGALVHWWVVGLATTTLVLVYRAMEARTQAAVAPNGFLGLAVHAPRLAFFFLLAALALVGLPGTLGFAAEDLLFHGSLESHPLLGLGLPIATAVNAISVLRLFATLFLGRRGMHVPPVPDALPRERFALTVPVLLLVTAGLVPAIFVSLRQPAAESLVHLLGGR